jgi:hypothetical protein
LPNFNAMLILAPSPPDPPPHAKVPSTTATIVTFAVLISSLLFAIKAETG